MSRNTEEQQGDVNCKEDLTKNNGNYGWSVLRNTEHQHGRDENCDEETEENLNVDNDNYSWSVSRSTEHQQGRDGNCDEESEENLNVDNDNYRWSVLRNTEHQQGREGNCDKEPEENLNVEHNDYSWSVSRKTEDPKGHGNCKDDLEVNLIEDHSNCGWKKNCRFMKHVAKNHMYPMHRKGKSYFLSMDENHVCRLVKETMETSLKPHRSSGIRGVYQKRFPTQVGQDGISHKPCFTVTVIVNLETNEIVTAFPTL